MTAIPPEAVTAAAVFIHDDECNDGDTGTCGRWRCGSDPASKFHSLHARHVEFYQARAQAILATAAPHICQAVLSELLKRHQPVRGSWGQSCGTCWGRGDSRHVWPCPEAVAIAALLPGGES